MMIAILVALLALSAAASASVFPVTQYFLRLVDKFTWNARHKQGGLLHHRIFRARCIILAEIFAQFMLLNLFGVFAVRIFLSRSQLKEQSWLLSFYWAVQTTTTIGK